jgi:hypothetical protein
MVVILNTWFTEDKSPCSGLSFCMLASSIVIEIKILLIYKILVHFMRHPLYEGPSKLGGNWIELDTSTTAEDGKDNNLLDESINV